ncbi:FixH family protein, partial [Vibrio parahaemolyticus]|nr:FixH family protein [Vibrio parahaemolyticus]
DRDFTKLVTADASGNYRLKAEESIQGPWFVELQPHDKQWMIQGKVEFPASSTPLMK